MGSSSKSNKSSQTTNTSTNVALEDLENSSVVTVAGNSNHITTTDHGAVRAAADIAFESLENQFGISQAAFDSINQAGAQNTAAIEKVALAAQSQGQSVVADSLVKVFQPFMLILLAGLVVVIIVAIRKGRKS